MSLPLTLSQASGVPYYRQIATQLTGLIRAGVLPAGAQLPPVRDLAAQLAVSLITVRKAYSELQQQQLVVAQRGSGTFVAPHAAGPARRATTEQARQVLRDALHRVRALGLEDEDIGLAWLTVFKEERDG